MKNKKREILVISILLVLQTILFVIVGFNKSYIHMDEAYSLGLASYDKVEIQYNEDFYDTWHTKDYYEDYLTVNDDEVGKYGQVYENQKNDVHPPLYYLFLRIAMGFSKNHFSMWPGIIINIVIYAFITIFTYLILQGLFKNKSHSKEKAIILAFISSITMASLTSVIYIRMYALSTLNILITTFLHMKLFESKSINIKLLVAIGISALLGSLTHYYYLFYLVMLFILFAIKYIKEKDYKTLLYYVLTMAIAGIASLVIFPYSIQHMFFGYRGQGVISNLTNIPQFLTNISLYLVKLNSYAFNGLLLPILILIIALVVYIKIKNMHNKSEKQSDFSTFITLSTLFYFLLVAVASPWIELRYIMPICGVVFIIVIYCLYNLVNKVFDEKKSNIIISVLLIFILLAPIALNISPEVLYSDKQEIVEKLENELNVPTLFFFNSQNNRFLDDILLFAILDDSYIAKDLDYNEDNIKEILQGKDISNGIVVFINEGQNNDNIIDTIKNSTNLDNSIYLKRLNACDVYYIN